MNDSKSGKFVRELLEHKSRESCFKLIWQKSERLQIHELNSD